MPRTPRIHTFPWALFRSVFTRFFVLCLIVAAISVAAFCAVHAFITWSFDVFAAVDGIVVRVVILTSAIGSFVVALAAADVKARGLDPKGEEV